MKHKKRLLKGVGLFSLLLSLLAPSGIAGATIVSSGGGSAAFDTSVSQVIDTSTIYYNGQFYYDGLIDPGYAYTQQGTPDGCKPFTINVSDVTFKGADQGTFKAILTTYPQNKNAANGSCPGTTKDITSQITNQQNINMPFDFIDSNTVITSDGKNTYKLDTTPGDSNNGNWLEVGGDQCKDVVTASNPPTPGSDSYTAIKVTASTGGQNTSYDNWPSVLAFSTSNQGNGGNGCTTFGPNQYEASDVYLNNPAILQKAPVAKFASAAGSGGGGCTTGTDANGNCTQSSDGTLDCGGGGLSWLICPIIDLAQKAAQQVDGFITNTLDVDVSNIFDNTGTAGASQGYYTAWNSFRILSIALLLIGGLVMVISQGLGFELLDAYTVRKVLPRILVAAIGISLSWPLMRYVIQLFDVIGFDIRALIYYPFHSLSGNISIGVGVLSTLTVGAGMLALGFASLTFILTALLAVFVAFLILVIRQIGIIFLVIFAPIAIASYVLPNTQRLWKLWRDNFLGLMLMFPIVSGFIAIGHAFSAVALSQGGGNVGGTLSQIIGVLAYFLPYFLLPVAFRLATGAIGTIAGFVNDQHRGAFDRLKQVRRGAMQRNWEATKAGNRFKGNNALSRRASSALQTATLLPSAGLRPRRMGANLRTARSASNFDQASKFMQENQSFQALKSDDDKLWAVMNGRNEQEVREILRRRGGARFADPTAMNDAVAEVMRVQREGGDAVARIAATRAQATTGTGFNYGRDDDDMLDAINRVAGSDRGLAGRMLGEMRGATVQSGRVDLGGGGYANQAQALQRRYNAMAGGPAYSAAEARQDVLESVIDSASGAQALYGKPASATAIGQAHANRIQSIVNGIQSGAVNPGTGRVYEQRDLDQALASTMGLYDAMNQASPQNARAMADALIGARVADPVNGGEISVYDLATDPTTVQNEAFIQMRRDYGNAAERAAAEAQGRVQQIQQQGGNAPTGPVNPFDMPH